MKYISTTELRTKSSELIEGLKAGESVNLIHRSEVVGVITPFSDESPAPSPEALQDFLRLAASSRSTSRKEREQAYHTHLSKKYGEGISRR
jgi:antitoxin (DNA-binding transcriptional repressor) of toxin-antitoxin stability system